MEEERTTFNIRLALPEDAPEICILAEQLGYPDSIDAVASRLQAILSDPSQVVFVVETGDKKVVGYLHAICQVSLETGLVTEVGGLVIHSDFRRMGLGKLLMAEAEKWAVSQGCQIIRLRSNIIRAEAHKFYRDLGYEIYKTQHAFIKSLVK